MYLSEARVFEPGPHRLPFTIPLSDRTAPTYRALQESRRFTVRAMVAIPWWLDAALERPVEVYPAFPEHVTAEPRSASSNQQDHGAMSLELTIDADAVRPGDIVSGQVALSVSAQDTSVRGLRLGLRECIGDAFEDFNTVVVQQIE